MGKQFFVYLSRLIFVFISFAACSCGPSQTTEAPEIWNSVVVSVDLTRLRNDFASGENKAANLVTDGSWFTNNRCFLFMHETPYSQKTIKKISYYIFQRFGDFAGSFSISGAAMYDFNGNFKRNLSVSSIDLKTAPMDVWNTFPLTDTASNRKINPGELLMFYIDRLPSPGSDMEVHLLLRVEVQ